MAHPPPGRNDMGRRCAITRREAAGGVRGLGDCRCHGPDDGAGKHGGEAARR
jgi:hypothetical protein